MKEQNIEVSDVSFVGVHGTSTSTDVIVLKCGGRNGCTDVVLRDVNIAPAVLGKNVEIICQNVHGPACSDCTPKVTWLG